ncbi:hypothetical protein MTR_6g009620 [Medicago truncatula]|uniref:Uncharacterized protein n=1 Tax=Medicago truncatula TaxID=3880 RepID=G7KKD5_MEDTR|nr:hypothetical protein MTR_6g009620 [Medicago truncatula]
MNPTLQKRYHQRQQPFTLSPLQTKSLPQKQQEQTLLFPWLIRVSQNTRGQTQFFHPLLNYAPLSCNSLVLDFNKLYVIPLGSNIFIWDYDIEKENIAHNCFYMFPEKVVVVTCHGKNPLIVSTLRS